MPSKDDPRKRGFISHQLAPGQIFILSFAGLILVGAFLLWFPLSSSGEQLNFIDALFTSTSAVCVTGLTVLDIGRDLSFVGQIITIFLFQIGGLGIITFSVFLFGIMGRGISFKDREIIQTAFLHTPKRDFLIILKAVLISTFTIESIGIIVLFIRFSQEFPSGTAFYYAVYHSISAFNNCGYTLFSDSLVRYQGDWIINLTIMILIIIGGIGFVVQHEAVSRFRSKQNRLSVHSKIVIYTTVFLILSGALLFYIFERNAIIKDMQVHSQFLVSFFQSITPRTAGFNTVDIGSLQNETILVMIILMFIGASPGSTGGGIKTTSATLLLLLIWNRWKGFEEVNVFNRTIPKEQITKTISIIFAAALSICLITSILLFTGGVDRPPQQSRHFFVEYLFETVSAFGTVGLSMGITSNLNDVQKLAIIIMMFAGRVGPLTLAFSLALRSIRKGITYAEETVMVG